MNNWYAITNDAKPRIDIFDEIGLFGVTAKAFIEDLRKLEDTATEADLFINSPGGSVFEGFAIYSAIKESKLPVDVTIYNAWSIASVVAMAGRSVAIAENGYFMIHNPRALTYGEEREMKKTIALLGKVKETIITAYASKTGKTREDIAQLMNDETWFDGADAVTNGFADTKIAAVKIAASFDVSKFDYVPPPLVAAISSHSDSRSSIGAATQKKEIPPMSESTAVSAGTPTNPVASYEDIVALCPGADSEFICDQLKRKVSQDQARSNWADLQNKRLADAQADAKAQRERADEAHAKLEAKAQANADGVPPLGNRTPLDDSGDRDDVIARWETLLAKHRDRPRMDAQKALSAAVRENPELHKEYLRAYNALHGRVVV